MVTSRSGALEEPLEHEIDPEVQRQIHQYPGKWVAVTRSELIAVGQSGEEVLGEARRKGFNIPILFRVPEDAATVHFF